jgi:DNA-binding transcriptional regulator YhcF (GntR family)
MKLQVDPQSPIPLYRQIQEALSYQIATGRLAAGSTLPSVRDLARLLSVNMHTARRAYQELVSEGLVISRGASGTQVRGDAASGSHALRRPHEVDVFLSRIVREARDKHRLTQSELVRRLRDWTPTGPAAIPVVHVVECSESQCLDHAREIEAAWEVEARPWCLSHEGELPSGPVIGTYFHYNEIRQRWPRRLHEVHFVSVRPDAALASRVRLPAGTGKHRTIHVVEFEEQKAANIAADLESLFPRDRFQLKPKVVTSASEPLVADGRTPLIYTPRTWAALTDEQRADPRVIKATYVIAPDDRERLGDNFGWRRRHS